MNPNLIKVFKASNPDKPLYADQGQINANPEVLIKWDNREAWLKQQGGKKPGKSAKQEEGGDSGEGDNGKGDAGEGDGGSKPETPTRTKKELQAELDARGIPYTKKMTVEQLEGLLADDK